MALELFLKLGEYNTITNETRIVNKDEFIGDYKVLAFNNGGNWRRRSAFSGKNNNYKFATVLYSIHSASVLIYSTPSASFFLTLS